MIDLLTLGLVFISSVISALNPCTIGVLLLTISVILGQGASPSRLFKSGSTYLFAVLLTYLAAGLGFAYLFYSLPKDFINYLSVVVGLLVVVAGLIQMKDFFWYGKGFSLQIPDRLANKIHKKSVKHKNLWGILLFGVFVAVVELPCSGASYLAVITLVGTEFTMTTALMILFYNLLFMVPLFFILIKIVRGTKTSRITRWKEKNKPLMRLSSGVLLVTLGWIILLSANGTVSF